MATQAKPDPRQAYYERLKPFDLSPLWEVLARLVPPCPSSIAAPARWRWADIRPLLLEAGTLISADEAERRVLILENPSLGGTHRITSTLYAGVQLVLPGEVAPCHRHTQSALRFVLEGSGAFTAVDGERIQMERWDLVLTPAMRWHDHGNETGEPIAWLDGLDIPIVSAFEAGFAEKLDGHAAHPTTRPPGDSLARFGSNLRPVRAEVRTGRLFAYPYSMWREVLARAARGGAPDPHDGYRFEFIDPATGGSATRTIAAFAQLLPAGFATRPQRSTDGQVHVVVEGRGRVELGDSAHEVAKGDIFVAPAWAMRRLSAGTDLVLFSFSDKAAQASLGLWREALA